MKTSTVQGPAREDSPTVVEDQRRAMLQKGLAQVDEVRRELGVDGKDPDVLAARSFVAGAVRSGLSPRRVASQLRKALERRQARRVKAGPDGEIVRVVAGEEVAIDCARGHSGRCASRLIGEDDGDRCPTCTMVGLGSGKVAVLVGFERLPTGALRDAAELARDRVIRAARALKVE